MVSFREGLGKINQRIMYYLQCKVNLQGNGVHIICNDDWHKTCAGLETFEIVFIFSRNYSLSKVPENKACIPC